MKPLAPLRIVVALLAGALFGFGLSLSGMLDPARVRVWPGNARSYAHLSEENCRELIDSLIAESGVGAESLSSKEKWWGNKQITDHPTVRKRDGYLIERSKSPFALVDIDSYEASR